MTDLLPCPFCGSEAEERLDALALPAFAHCTNIDCVLHKSHTPITGFVWNTRHAPWQPIDTLWDNDEYILEESEFLGAVGKGYQGGVITLHKSKVTGAFFDSDGDTWKPTHWMPLPEPPKG